MAKARTTIFFCQNCGYESAKWMGQCPACHGVEHLRGGTCRAESFRLRFREADCGRDPVGQSGNQERGQQEQEWIRHLGRYCRQQSRRRKRAGLRALPLKDMR